jgi:WD40 repeat protein
VQVHLTNTEGKRLGKSVRGDMYLHDQTHTKGHTQAAVTGAWHPSDATQFATGGEDGTIRLWNTADYTKQNKHVIKFKVVDGSKPHVTAVAYSGNGTLIAAGSTNGGIQVWKGQGPYVRASQKNMTAHAKGEIISHLLFHQRNPNILFSRSCDGTVKVWKASFLKRPLAEIEGLHNAYAETNMTFSPDGKFLLTGTSTRSKAGQGGGDIVVIDTETYQVKHRVQVANRGVIRVHWHPVLNQIAFTTSEGKTQVLYDPKVSQKGVLLCATVSVRRHTQTHKVSREIINPNALPAFQSRKRKKRGWKDPREATVPTRPLEGGKGQHGRVAQYGSGSITQYMLQKMMPEQNKTALLDARDPRAEVLAYAEEAKDGMWMGKAYKDTQPEAIFHQPTEEELAMERLKSETVANKRAEKFLRKPTYNQHM